MVKMSLDEPSPFFHSFGLNRKQENLKGTSHVPIDSASHHRSSYRLEANSLSQNRSSKLPWSGSAARPRQYTRHVVRLDRYHLTHLYDLIELGYLPIMTTSSGALRPRRLSARLTSGSFCIQGQILTGSCSGHRPFSRVVCAFWVGSLVARGRRRPRRRSGMLMHLVA